jgi:exodeoxyribonuclease V alpha subunit
MSFIRGYVERVFHTSGTYNALSFHVLESSNLGVPKDTKVSGHFFGISKLIPRMALELDGEWSNHSKYGRQYKIHKWSPWAKNKGDVSYFLKECVEIFSDQQLLQRVVNRWGVRTYDVLMGDEVFEVASNEEERKALNSAKNKWQTVRGIAALSDLLQEYDFGTSVVASIFNRFGFDSIEVISQNPYRLLEIEGISFHRVDFLANRRGIEPGDLRRIAGAVLWVIRDQVRQQGHLFVRRGDLTYLLNELSLQEQVEPFVVSNLSASIESALIELERVGAVKVDPGVGVYTPEMYLYERGAAAKLSKFLTPLELIIDLEGFLKEYEKVNDITLSDLQREAVIQLLAHRVLIITGAPGTGKTTLIRTFVQLFKQLGMTYMLMAPTGIAAKRLASVTGVEAQTIHRALKYDGFQWGHDNSDLLETQAIICDEASMLDQEVFYRLLDALESHTMLVLVGDDAQLPSVGPGNVLRELLACKAVPHVQLDQVFRQAETSAIVLAAHNIRKGISPLSLPFKEDSEFRFVQMSSDKDIANMVVQMAAKLKGRDANFQVLSPKYEGTVGVDNLNRLLRNQLNPDKGQLSWELLDIRVGDRLMIIKNNYKLNVYNGDIGKLKSINKDSLTLKIHGVGHTPDMNVNIPKELAPQMLKLAYAVTVHRCQGEEFETIILPLVRAHGRMLQRNLFYTAITRARKRVWVLGDTEAVIKAVANDKVVQRNTVLRDLVVST